jgi:phospholipase/carboxylesterase
MRRAVAILVGCGFLIALGSVSAADEAAESFQGEWRTSIGVVHLVQKGETVTGAYGPRDAFQIKGKAKGKVLDFEFEEGQAKGDARFTLDQSGNAFAGGFQIRGGRQGAWNGWRPDPRAVADRPASFAGLWLTDAGLMELSQDSGKVQGRYASRGNSTIEGKVTGRHLAFRFKNLRGGQGWFDVASDGKSLAGAANTDGFPGWFGWQGRQAPEYVRHAPLVSGKLVLGSTKALLTYAVRAPEAYQAGSSRRWPTVLILHGSSMNGQSYVSTLAEAWPDIARDFILLGINGELATSFGEQPGFSYTYVNYVGRSRFTGYPCTNRESPALLSEAMTELKDIYPISRYFVGGHSQGGFLTYSLLMNFPDLMAGAFPISSTVIIQCEPDAYTGDALRQAQRAVPLAIVHGKNDPIVPFSAGQYAATLFGEANWPAFRFFTHDSAAHMFARLPVGPAIRWLEVLSSDDPAAVLEFAARRLSAGGYRDTIAGLRRLSGLKLDERQRNRTDEIKRAVADKAAPEVAKFLPQVRAAGPKDASWVDAFLAFRDDFEFAEPARELMAAFADLRAQHEAPARTAFDAARGLFNDRKPDEAYKKYQEIVDSYYASSLYRVVKRALAERK